MAQKTARTNQAAYPPVARVVAVGTGMARLQIRNRAGRWVTESLIEDESAYVRDLIRRFEDLAAWARGQALRPFERKLAAIERKLSRAEATVRFLHPRRKR
jgi:hypothetical protein